MTGKVVNGYRSSNDQPSASNVVKVDKSCVIKNSDDDTYSQNFLNLVDICLQKVVFTKLVEFAEIDKIGDNEKEFNALLTFLSNDKSKRNFMGSLEDSSTLEFLKFEVFAQTFTQSNLKQIEAYSLSERKRQDALSTALVYLDYAPKFLSSLYKQINNPNVKLTREGSGLDVFTIARGGENDLRKVIYNAAEGSGIFKSTDQLAERAFKSALREFRNKLRRTIEGKAEELLR